MMALMEYAGLLAHDVLPVLFVLLCLCCPSMGIVVSPTWILAMCTGEDSVLRYTHHLVSQIFSQG